VKLARKREGRGEYFTNMVPHGPSPLFTVDIDDGVVISYVSTVIFTVLTVPLSSRAKLEAGAVGTATT